MSWGTVEKTNKLFPCHDFLHVISLRGESGAELDQLAVFAHKEIVFDADAQVLFRNVNARFDGEGHSRA